MISISEERKSWRPLSDSQREMLEEATASYARTLSDEAFDYLEARGISAGTVAGFRLGEVRDPHPGHENLVGWLCIPYLGQHGQPLKLRFRRLGGQAEPKYMDLPNAIPRMFNVRAVHQAEDQGHVIHVAEGELDAVILNQLGLPAVGIPGVNAWQWHHKKMLAGFNRVWVWADADANKAGERLANTITEALPSAKVVRLPFGDVTEVHQQLGPDALLSLIEGKR